MIELNKIYFGDCMEVLNNFPDESVNCCVTSPPYYGLRDYGTAKWVGGSTDCNHFRDNHIGNSCITGHNSSQKEGGIADSIFKTIYKKCGAIREDQQIGLEETPELYVQKLVRIFAEVKRILRQDGTLWLNLGDSYAGSGKGGQSEEKRSENWQPEYGNKGKRYGLKPKDLIGVPWLVAFALRADGWYLRQDIIWAKPNPMPESVTDRCTKSHEYIFLLSKSAKYYYDQELIKEPVTDETIVRMNQQIENQKGSDRVPGKSNGNMKAVGPGRNPRKGIDINGGNQASAKGIPAMAINGKGVKDHSGYYNQAGELVGGGMANKKSVWTVTTKPFKEAHFATFPEDLIVPCIKAGCSEGGTVIDPFIGAGTTGLVARKLNRNYIGIELNPEYIKIAEKRIFNEIGLFK